MIKQKTAWSVWLFFSFYPATDNGLNYVLLLLGSRFKYQKCLNCVRHCCLPCLKENETVTRQTSRERKKISFIIEFPCDVNTALTEKRISQWMQQTPSSDPDFTQTDRTVAKLTFRKLQNNCVPLLVLIGEKWKIIFQSHEPDIIG